MTQANAITDAITNAIATIPRPRSAASLSLICLHAAGSGASMFRRWPDRLSDDVELVLVQLPGRETRINETPFTEFSAALDALMVGLADRLDRPHVLFGHSMGAQLATGVAGRRRAEGRRNPERLIVSGSRPPHLFRPLFPLGQDTDVALVAALKRMGGTQRELLDNPDILKIILPTLRADLQVCRTAEPPPVPIDCSIIVFGGRQDTIPENELAEWSRLSSHPVARHMFPGRHFFLTVESEPAVLEALTSELLAVRRELSMVADDE